MIRASSEWPIRRKSCVEPFGPAKILPDANSQPPTVPPLVEPIDRPSGEKAIAVMGVPGPAVEPFEPFRTPVMVIILSGSLESI
jgi:hypothetical protein